MSENGMIKFSCLIRLRSKEEGGRHTPISNGFRSDIKFEDAYRMAVFEFNKDWLFPGESMEGTFTVLLHCDSEIDKLLRDKSILIADGANQIGEVEISGVINRDSVIWD